MNSIRNRKNHLSLRPPKMYYYNFFQCTRRYKSMKNLTRHQRNCNGVPPPAVKPTWRKDSIDGRYYCTFEGCNSKKNWTCSSGVWKVSFLIVISYVSGEVFLCSKSYTIIFKLFPFYCYSIIMQSMRT